MDPDAQILSLGPGEGRHVLALGDVRTLKTTGEDTGGALTLLEQTVAAGASSALHHHPYREVFYVLEGELEFHGLRAGERVVLPARAGSTLAVPPNVAHGYANVGAGPARFLAIIEPAGVERFLLEVGVEFDDPAAPPSGAPALDRDALVERAGAYGIRFVEE